MFLGDLLKACAGVTLDARPFLGVLRAVLAAIEVSLVAILACHGVRGVRGPPGAPVVADPLDT